MDFPYESKKKKMNLNWIEGEGERENEIGDKLSQTSPTYSWTSYSMYKQIFVKKTPPHGIS